jgi:hypothetical protein
VRAVRTGGGGPFPTALLVQPWQNPQAQLFALRNAIGCQPDVVTFASAGALFPPVAGSRNSCGAANQAWCCVGVYATLLRLAYSGGLATDVLAILQAPRMHVPELVLIGVATVRRSNAEVRPCVCVRARARLECMCVVLSVLFVVCVRVLGDGIRPLSMRPFAVSFSRITVFLISAGRR